MHLNCVAFVSVLILVAWSSEIRCFVNSIPNKYVYPKNSMSSMTESLTPKTLESSNPTINSFELGTIRKKITRAILNVFEKDISQRSIEELRRYLIPRIDKLDYIHIITLMYRSAVHNIDLSTVIDWEIALNILKYSPQRWNSQSIGNAIYSLKNTNASIHNKNILMKLVAQKVELSKDPLSGQCLGNALYGLHKMSSDSQSLLLLVRALAMKVNPHAMRLSAQEIANAIWGLQGMDPAVEEVSIMMYKLSEGIDRSVNTDASVPHNLFMSAQHVGMSLFALRNMSSHAPATRRLLQSLIPLMKGVALDRQATGNSFLGLSQMHAEHKEVRQLMGELVKSLHLSMANTASKQSQQSPVPTIRLGDQEIASVLSGLQTVGKDTSFKEVRDLICVATQLLLQSTLAVWADKDSHSRSASPPTLLFGPHAVSSSIHALRNMNSDCDEVRVLLATITSVLLAVPWRGQDYLSGLGTVRALHGLEGLLHTSYQTRGDKGASGHSGRHAVIEGTMGALADLIATDNLMVTLLHSSSEAQPERDHHFPPSRPAAFTGPLATAAVRSICELLRLSDSSPAALKLLHVLMVRIKTERTLDTTARNLQPLLTTPELFSVLAGMSGTDMQLKEVRDAHSTLIQAASMKCADIGEMLRCLHALGGVDLDSSTLLRPLLLHLTSQVAHLPLYSLSPSLSPTTRAVSTEASFESSFLRGQCAEEDERRIRQLGQDFGRAIYAVGPLLSRSHDESGKDALFAMIDALVVRFVDHEKEYSKVPALQMEMQFLAMALYGLRGLTGEEHACIPRLLLFLARSAPPNTINAARGSGVEGASDISNMSLGSSSRIRDNVGQAVGMSLYGLHAMRPLHLGDGLEGAVQEGYDSASLSVAVRMVLRRVRDQIVDEIAARRAQGGTLQTGANLHTDDSLLDSQAVAMCLYGLRGMSCDLPEAGALLRTLIPEIAGCREVLPGRELAVATAALVSMDASRPPVRNLIKALTKNLQSLSEEESLQKLCTKRDSRAIFSSLNSLDKDIAEVGDFIDAFIRYLRAQEHFVNSAQTWTPILLGFFLIQEQLSSISCATAT